jgi:hypothetical protein
VAQPALDPRAQLLATGHRRVPREDHQLGVDHRHHDRDTGGQPLGQLVQERATGLR